MTKFYFFGLKPASITRISSTFHILRFGDHNFLLDQLGTILLTRN